MNVVNMIYRGCDGNMGFVFSISGADEKILHFYRKANCFLQR
jgi:hypothetical protein